MENETTVQPKSGFHSQFGSFLGRVSSSVSLTVRKRMYEVFENRFPNPQSVLDVGVTSESVAPEANYFEEMFPFKERITAVGVEDAGHLEEKYPGLRFIKVNAGQRLPFSEKEFEVVFSNAVLEHIVKEDEQEKFIRELLRVGKNVFLTTPHKFFPVEHHTGIPLLHFMNEDLFFKWIERKKQKNFYNRLNLKPLGPADIRRILNRVGCEYELQSVRFCGFISNWVVILRTQRAKG